ENRVERGGFAGAIWTDDSEDAAFFDPQIDAVQRDSGAENFAETACFYTSHVSAPARGIGILPMSLIKGFNVPPCCACLAGLSLSGVGVLPGCISRRFSLRQPESFK